MNMFSARCVIALSLGCMVGSAHAELASFYTLSAEGAIYSVNGTTLETSLVVDLGIGAGGLEHEILYLTDGGVLVNNGRNLIRYDLGTGEQRVVFAPSSQVGSAAIMMGLAATDDGNVYTTVRDYTDMNELEYYGAIYNPFTGEFDRQANVSHPFGLYFDHHQVGENIFLGAAFSSEQVSVINSLTGDTTFYDVGFEPVSFFESDGEVYSFGKEGQIYTFDILTGESEVYGVLQGDQPFGGWIGAASISAPFLLPTPSTLAMFGFASAIAIRRRR